MQRIFGIFSGNTAIAMKFAKSLLNIPYILVYVQFNLKTKITNMVKMVAFFWVRRFGRLSWNFKQDVHSATAMRSLDVLESRSPMSWMSLTIATMNRV